MLDAARAANETAAHNVPKKRRKFWLHQLHQWHWISSAICLIGMLLFSITGITLNHAGQIEATPSTARVNERVPPALLQTLTEQYGRENLSVEITDWLDERLSERIAPRALEWSEDELYIALARSARPAWKRRMRSRPRSIFSASSAVWNSRKNTKSRRCSSIERRIPLRIILRPRHSATWIKTFGPIGRPAYERS